MAVNYVGIALVLNCGSSSVKYQVVDTTVDAPLASGLIERVTDHGLAIREVIDSLSAPGSGVDLSKLTVIGHRVLHGGEEFSAPTIIDDEVESKMTRLIPLGPLHMPPNLSGIAAAREAFPDKPHVAIFDTAFFQTLSEAAYTYAIDKNVAAEHSIRKYGFHGTSYAYLSHEVPRVMGKNPEDVNFIALHLGNGASVTAIRGGKAIDTSMGLTPLAGLVMGTRAGDIDPAVAFHLGRSAGMTLEEIDHLFNRQSGMLGLTGYSDMRDVEKAASEGAHDAQLGLDIYCRRIRGYIGQYYAHLGHLDAVVFTAGVGENSDIVRGQALAGLEELGIHVDAERNAGRKKQATLISTDDSPIAVWVVPTNEEREIALQSIAAVS